MSQRKARAGGILRTSLDNSWQTPPHILACARAYFGGEIPFDPATAQDNPTRALRYCAGVPGTLFAQGLPADDMARRNGLEVSWDWPTWLNPPYGEELRAWLLKVEREAARHTTILLLIPTTRWETDYLQRLFAAAVTVCLIRGRVAFVSTIDGAEVPGNSSGSMILGFNVNPMRFAKAFSDPKAPLGTCFGVRSLAREAVA